MSFRDTFDPFEDLNRQKKNAASNGYTVEDISQTAHTVFCALMGDNNFVHNVPWHDLDDAGRDMWEPVARMAVYLMDNTKEAEVYLSVSKTAGDLYRQFTALNDVPEYATTPEPHKIVWQAIVRHLANVIDCEGGINIPEAEERIIEWARDRISGPQTVLA